MPKLVKYFHMLDRYCAMEGRKGKVKVHLNLTSLLYTLLDDEKFIYGIYFS